jgi:aspartate kinase
MESNVVAGVAYSRDEAKMTLISVADRPGIAAAIFGPLSEAGVNVDMIVQNISTDGKLTDMTFTVPRGDVDRAIGVLEVAEDLKGAKIISSVDVAKISVVGIGMRSHAGVAQKMFETLAEKGINIQVISTSEIKISVLIAEEYSELAVRTLHSAYGLEKPV